MTTPVIYFDNNATTPIAPEVVEAMLPYLTTYYGNPSSMHTFGGQVRHAVENARQQVARLLNADPEEIIFTSCGTEADNTALFSAAASNPSRRKIITTKVEHPAVLSTVAALQQQGYHVEYIPVDKQGRLDLEYVKKMVDQQTALLSVMWANNETGTIFPIHELAEIAHQAGALFHTDAVQAVGKIEIDVKKSQIDFLALSGHKLHAPKGVGVLYVRKGTKLTPYLIGGHQEEGRRAGTENVASIVALGKAAEIAGEKIAEEQNYVRGLRDRLQQGILASCPDAIVNGDQEHRLPNTCNISFQYIEGESILLLLNQHNIAASSGSACTSGSLEPSHVLRALQLPYTFIHGSIRFSLSRYNTEEEVDKVLEVLPPIIKYLRQLSPFGK